MKRYFSLTLALLMGVFGFGFSEKTVESREALLSAQPVVAELTAAAAPAPEITIKSLSVVEAETVLTTELVTEPVTEPVTELTTKPAIKLTAKIAAEVTTVSEAAAETEPVTEETTKAPETTEAPTESEKISESSSGYAWPADLNAEVIASYPSYSDGSAHWGVDIGLYDDGTNVSEGTYILAARDGVVVTVYNDGKWNTGFGNYCVIDHGNGVQTLYAHSKDIRVNEGDAVVQGQVIGIVGDTGNTTAPHLHFEVRVENGNGSYKRVNPLKFISEP
ncbi:MAG: M23 family metallopeptidase [Ruminococcaceae bacterium]|nr:M23 family metallopeptidase [Oscillospiraceae bacterium]